MYIAESAQIIWYGIACLFAFFLPGYFFSEWLGSPTSLLSAFVISLMVLCQGFFWLEVLGVPLQFWTIMAWEFLCTFIAMACVSKMSRAFLGSKNPPNPPARISLIIYSLIAMAIITGTVLLLRAWLVPMTGPDLGNRWELLANQAMRLGHYHFYPPVRGEDFPYYGFPESLPPMLTAVIWWIYTAIGRAAPSATAPFVVLQYAVMMGLVYRLGENMHSQLAGGIAMALIAGAPLTFFSLVMGQETGLIAIGVLVMVYYIHHASGDWRSAILAAIGAALGALVREYALIIIPLGIVLAIWHRRSIQWILTFTLTAALLAIPWYIRTWLLTGNPIYSLSFFGLFPTNPIIAAQYRLAGEYRSAWIMPVNSFIPMLQHLLEFAPLQIIFGIFALIATLRRRSWLLMVFLLLFGIWFISLGLSDSLLVWLRTLLPALAVLSVLMAMAVLPAIMKSPMLRSLALAILFAAWAYSLLFGLIYPRRLSETPPDQWLSAAMSNDARRWDQDVRNADIPSHLPAGCRVLSTDLYAYAALMNSPNPVVPLWSPEVSFIFDSTQPLPEVYRRLKAIHICAIWFSPADLRRFPANPLYSHISPTWAPLARGGQSALYKIP